MTFMQDNAPIHTARKMKKRLEDHDIKTTDWPLYSPDLTVIEHMWFKLKEVIYQICMGAEPGCALNTGAGPQSAFNVGAESECTLNMVLSSST